MARTKQARTPSAGGKSAAALEKLLCKGEAPNKRADRGKLRAAITAAGDAAAPLVLQHVTGFYPGTRMWLVDQVEITDADTARIVAGALGWWGAHEAYDDALAKLLPLSAMLTIPALATARDEARANDTPIDWLDEAMERVLDHAGADAEQAVARLPAKQRKVTQRILDKLGAASRAKPTARPTKAKQPRSLEALLTDEQTGTTDPDRDELQAAIAKAGPAAGPLIVQHAHQVSPATRVWMLQHVQVSEPDAATVIAGALGWHEAHAAFDAAVPLLLAIAPAISLPALAAADQDARTGRRNTDWIARAMERVLVHARAEARGLVAALPARQRKYARRILDAIAEESSTDR
jgi:hypothetical protein